MKGPNRFCLLRLSALVVPVFVLSIHSEAQQAPDDAAGSVIAAARAAMSGATSADFTALETITRYTSSDNGKTWKGVDVVTADVSSIKRKQTYRNIRVNGKPTKHPEASGAWTQGEFQEQLDDLFSTITSAVFTLLGHEEIAGRMAWRFSYSVDQKHSRLHLLSQGARYTAPYGGELWIDQETSGVLRVELTTGLLPPDFPLTSSESSMQYGFVNIDGNSFLLLLRGEAQSCASAQPLCARNVIEFQDYRKL